MKLFCVIVAILASTATARDIPTEKYVEDLEAVPSAQSAQRVEAPFNAPNENRGTQKYGNQQQSRYYYPQNNYVAPQNNYVPPQNNYVPAQNNYVPAQNNYVPAQNNYVPAQNNYVPAQNNYVSQSNNYQTTQSSYVPSQTYYWTTQKPYFPTQATYATQKPQYTHPPQQNQNTWTQNTWTTTPASVVKNEFYSGDNGSYKYEYQITDGTHVGEEGYFLNPNTENQSLVKKGWYSYVGADGYTYLVTYWADHTGYHPTFRKYLQ